MSATLSPAPVTERALLQRVNRKLAHANERVSKHHPGQPGAYMLNPQYTHFDTNYNRWLGEFDDLEAFARRCGVLAESEVMAR